MHWSVAGAGTQWLCAANAWLIKDFKLEGVIRVEQGFYIEREDGHIYHILAQVVDELLIAGTDGGIIYILSSLNQSFKRAQICRGDKLKVFGCSLKLKEYDGIDICVENYSD